MFVWFMDGDLNYGGCSNRNVEHSSLTEICYCLLQALEIVLIY